jgi:hypothetical protein
MQKTLFHHLVNNKGYTYKSCEYLYDIISKLMIYGFLNFFWRFGRIGPPESLAQKGQSGTFKRKLYPSYI